MCNEVMGASGASSYAEGAFDLFDGTSERAFVKPNRASFNVRGDG